MARRKKSNAGKAAAAAAKAKSLKKANGQATDAVKVELEESISQDTTEARPAPPTSRVVEICPDRTLTPTPQVIPVDIVHKKFGKLRCLVETEVISREQSPKDRFDDPKQSDTPNITENLGSIGDISEVLWEEEVVEETIECEELDMEIDEERSGISIKEFKLQNTFNKVNDDESNESEISMPPDSFVAKKVPDITTCSNISSQKLDELKSEEILVYKREDFESVSTSESEVTSREEDSQDSLKVSESDADVNAVAQLMEQSKLLLHNANKGSPPPTVPALGRRQLRSSASRTALHIISPTAGKSPKASIKKAPSINVAMPGDIMNPVLNNCLKTKLNDIHLEQQNKIEIVRDIIDIEVDKSDTNSVLETIVKESLMSEEKVVVATPLVEVTTKVTIAKLEDDVSVENKPQTPTFRSRSGSTDTTGSESSSNCSSIVRRSSRIRSISTTKQRTKNRFQALKVSAEEAKVAESRDSSDNNSGTETFSDRENNISTKMPVPMSSLCISNSSGSKQQDTIFKPVKVKSRWRRSSELEMVGNRNSDGEVVGGSLTPSHSPLFGAPRTPTSSPRPPAFVAPVALASPTPSVQSAAEEPVPTIEFPLKKDPRVDRKLREDKEMEERLRQFENLTENHYLTERSTSKEFRGMICDCFLTKDEAARGELGCGEDCLNRLLMIECGSRCTLGDRCTNKHFQKQEYSKCEVFKTEKKGYGLRATEDLPSGAFLLEYVGEVVNAKEFRRRAKEYSKDKNRHYYFMALKSDSVIDATMKGNISRFINHSCDPNAETQKWTVNGELRIGFFTSKSVAAWEELTFDYQFQRYGKEAQRCHCESTLCRGWIGEDPEKEKEKAERKEKKDQEVSKKKREEVKLVEPEEEDSDEIDTNLEQDIEELCQSGLKNRNHTLSLCRLMVRSQDADSRVQLLRLIQRGEPACLRLFLDYHGLRLIAKWMSDIDTNVDTADVLRTEILQTLSKLPIQNKTVLQDSKVLSMVEKWIVTPVVLPTKDETQATAAAEQKVDSVSPSEASQDSVSAATVSPLGEPINQSKVADIQEINTSPTSETKIPGILDTDEVAVINEEINDLPSASSFVLLATSLLAEWSNLKEVFRIPKKERIEQMKEHEREADRGYKEYLDKEDNQTSKQSYDRHWRQRTADIDKNRDRKKPPSEVEKIRKSRFEDRCIVQIPGLSKEERRQMFALKVAKEEEEERQRKLVEEAGARHRKGLEEQWRIHEEQCRALEVDPNTTAFDWETGCMAVFDPSTGNWIQYPPLDQHLNNMGQNPEMGTPQILCNNPPTDHFNPMNQQFDPNQPYHVSNPHYPPSNQITPYQNSYDSNPHFDPNHPMQGQIFDHNNPMHQFNTIPNWDYPPHFNPNNPNPDHSAHYPNNPMHPQFNPHNPHNPTFSANNPVTPQYNSSNPMHPPYMGAPYDPMHGPFHAVDGSHLAALPPPEPPASVDYEPPPLPYDSAESALDREPPANPCLIPVKITPNACIEGAEPPVPAVTKEQVVFPSLPPDLLQVPLPPNWKWARDRRGFIYYYHTEERISRWKPPWELLDPDANFDSASEGSEDEEDVEDGDSPLEDDDDADDGDDGDEVPDSLEENATVQCEGGNRVAEKGAEDTDKDRIDASSKLKREASPFVNDEQRSGAAEGDDNVRSVEGLDETTEKKKSITCNEPLLKKIKLETDKSVQVPVIAHRPEETRKRREGLVQERIISPRCKEDRPEKTNYRVIKEKLLQRKKQQARKSRSKKKRHDREGKPRVSRKSEKAVAVEFMDNPVEAARKIKDNFRLQMAGAIVQYLNPFRKPDCSQGRITKTEDFKHLARKLTHFVMLKELKHCQNVDDLVCNDSVKHKARDFIRKYMSKFGTLYQRPIDDD